MARSRVVLVPGTHQRSWDEWWRPGSAFSEMLFDAGIRTVQPLDPFRWSSDLDGLCGDELDWQTAGDALRWYCEAYARGEVVNIIAHSHGGQVVAYALAALRGLHVATLVTVATPVRPDVPWSTAAEAVGSWAHFYSPDDLIQMAGSVSVALPQGQIAREMPTPAANVEVPGESHSGLLAPALWRDRGWLDLLL